MRLAQLPGVSYQLGNLQNEINRLFNGQFLASREDGSNVETGQWAPRVDIKEEDDQFIVLADLPGVPPEAIEISVDHDLLSISGKREVYFEKKEEGYLRTEREMGSFCRRFSLPESANLEKISAKNKHGVLEITIPKQEKKTARRIHVEIDK